MTQAGWPYRDANFFDAPVWVLVIISLALGSNNATPFAGLLADGSSVCASVEFLVGTSILGW